MPTSSDGSIWKNSSYDYERLPINDDMGAGEGLQPLLDPVRSINTEYSAPQKRFLRLFPPRLESWLRPFDDYVINLVQSHCAQGRLGKFFYYWDVFMTALVSIEGGMAAPFVFFVVGWDSMGVELSYLMLLLCLFSQIPKRFLWRPRPYMAGRAFKVRAKETAVTSSFPSRAVTCAAVYSFYISISVCYDAREDRIVLQWWVPLFIVAAVLLSSQSRIDLGVHYMYPSDCVVGLLQGVLICIIGTGLRQLDTVGCDSCGTGDCYARAGSSGAISSEFFGRVNFVVFSVSVAVSIVIVIIAASKPLDFWGKCDSVFGALCPGIVFQMVFLCPRTAGSSLAAPAVAPWYAYIYGIGIAGIALGIGFKTSGKVPMLPFLLVFSILFCALVLWRVLLF